MKKNWFVRILSLTILSILVLTGSVFAADDVACDVDFNIREEADSVKVEMVVKNASFTDIQAGLRYNPLVLCPMDENGELTDEFDSFAKLSEKASFLKTDDAVLDSKRGFFEFALSVSPDADAEGINEKGECVVGKDGINIYTFSFKKIADGAVTVGGVRMSALDKEYTDYSLGTLHFTVNDKAAGKTVELKFGANTYANDGEDDVDFKLLKGCAFKVGGAEESAIEASDSLVVSNDAGENEISLIAPEGEIMPGDTISVPVVIANSAKLRGAMFQVVWNTEYLSMSDKYIEEDDSYEAYTDKPSLFDGLFSVALNKIKPGDMELELAAKDSVKPYGKAEEGIKISGREGFVAANVSYINGENISEVTVKPGPTVVPDPYPGYTSADRKKDVICLKIGENMTYTLGEKKQIDDTNKKVVPYIKNDRTLVPMRFIAEALGAEVIWEDGWDGCIIKKGEDEIKITFGSAEFTVNGKTVTYEAPIEVVNERTMVPVRFVSEQLGCDVYWNANNQAVVIAPLDNPWEESREVEAKALGEMLISILGIL